MATCCSSALPSSSAPARPREARGAGSPLSLHLHDSHLLAPARISMMEACMTESGTATIGRSPDSLSLRQQVDRAERRHFMRMMAFMMPSVFLIALFFL